MAVEIQVKIEDQEVKNLLTRLQQRSSDLTPVMRTIGEIVKESVERNFEEERAPDGARWIPSVRAMLTGGKTLTNHGTLKNSIKPHPSNDRVAIGTNVAYAAVHQFGGKTRAGGPRSQRGRKSGIPARPYLGVRTRDWAEIKAAIGDYLVRK